MSDFVKVGRLADFGGQRGRVVQVDGERVAVFRIGERIHAIQDACPHMGASLADGVVHRGSVICHWHGWRFDLETGQGDERAWACAAVYEVKVDGDEVWLRAPASPPKPPEEPANDDEDWIFWEAERYFRERKPDDGESG